MDTTKSNQYFIMSRMHKAHRQIHLYLEEHTQDLGLSPTELHLLSYLRVYAPCPVKELVRVFGQKASTLTSILDRMEAIGLVTREANPSDRRSFLVRSTPAADPLVAYASQVICEFECRLMATVTPEQLAGYLAVLQAVNELTGMEVRPPRAPVAPATPATPDHDPETTPHKNPHKENQP